jgi:hypothetical protein
MHSSTSEIRIPAFAPSELRLPSEFLDFPPPEPALTDATSAAHAARPHKV